nr:RecName: Full=Periviscerokinin-2.1; Short=PVK-2.1; AltName: Full=Periviscerokinin-3; Short=PseFo-PVK-3; Contains: RecName: Full=Periviscerokinin-2.2; Short=PVK-2.2; AltName: Full=Periviscerokinin-2; Short=PseFo-PVK-2 [Pseudoderopeltis foveolata]P84377.1 RecName: Full=Periviscerokinin-2.1; Short=PVK-2.1; AltName: Full=Periviscerokinin-3; Short=PseFl-PVK-3; Contains: RecName: Full=Periviscerokinin-2.2; Short=PVK-2.2; AltName: Full=Periviscerokinin-2; Short=PseFl-PVK-2 [Pseudoderopeltis flavescens
GGSSGLISMPRV